MVLGTRTIAVVNRDRLLSIAVVPFANISGRPADDWLGSSIAETVIRDHGAGPWSLTSAPTWAAPGTGATRCRSRG